MEYSWLLGHGPTMIYWTLENGTISRAESRNSHLLGPGDGIFAAPFASNAIVGTNLYESIDGLEIAHLYMALAAQVLKTGQPISFPYRCDSPAIRREMNMGLSRDVEMVRYESCVIRETGREYPIPLQVNDASAFVAICSFCQKFRFPLSSAIWKELERLLLEPDVPEFFKFTHGICEACYFVVLQDLPAAVGSNPE